MIVADVRNDASIPTVVWWLLLALVVATFLALFWGVPHEEADLTERVSAVLQDSGVAVDFDGRDAVLSGTAPSEGSLGQLAATVEQIPGVRVVNAGAVVVLESASSQVAAGQEKLPEFSVSFTDSILVLSGSVLDVPTLDDLIGNAEDQYGAGNVVVDVDVDGGGATPKLAAVLPELFAVLGDLDEWYLVLEAGALTFRGFGSDVDAVTRVNTRLSRFSESVGQLEGTAEVQPKVLAESLTELFAWGSNFQVDRAELSNLARERLDVIARLLRSNRSTTLTIEGHTDNVGDPDANLALSEARAQAVVDHLVQAGIDPLRLVAVGYGDTLPMGNNATAEGRAMNRRISFVATEGENS